MEIKFTPITNNQIIHQIIIIIKILTIQIKMTKISILKTMANQYMVNKAIKINKLIIKMDNIKKMIKIIRETIIRIMMLIIKIITNSNKLNMVKQIIKLIIRIKLTFMLLKLILLKT